MTCVGLDNVESERAYDREGCCAPDAPACPGATKEPGFEEEGEVACADRFAAEGTAGIAQGQPALTRWQ